MKTFFGVVIIAALLVQLVAFNSMSRFRIEFLGWWTGWVLMFLLGIKLIWQDQKNNFDNRARRKKDDQILDDWINKPSGKR